MKTNATDTNSKIKGIRFAAITIVVKQVMRVMQTIRFIVKLILKSSKNNNNNNDDRKDQSL